MHGLAPWLLIGLTVSAWADEPSPPPAPVAAPEPPASDAPDDDAYEVTVFGDGDRAVDDVPGSAAVVTAEDLRAMKPLSGNEVLSTVAGVHVVDEEGIGLRANIGIRGLDPTRSRNVLMLEDGVPIALAPYGEPEMYYNPPIDRMERVEVVKGSGSIRFGPQTIGGVINYVTPDPTEDLSAHIALRGGTFGYLQGLGTLSDTLGPVGFHLTAFHQRFPGPRNLNLVRTDLTGKLLFHLGAGHTLAAKVGFYDEQSQATYLGLTTPQFETDPRFNFAVYDHFSIRRYGATLTHNLDLGPDVHLRTTAYFHYIHRDWWRQDFDRGDLGYDYERIIDGKGQDVLDDPEAWSDDGTQIWFRDSTAMRGRKFTVGGIEPTLSASFQTGAVHHDVDAGVRAHFEHAHEVYVEADGATSRDGVVVDEADRHGTAVAAWFLDRLDLAHGVVQVSPGIRLETLWTTDEVMLQNGEALATPIVNHRTYVAPLPGLGVAVHPTPATTVFAGIHRGWAPPRTKDGVTTDGTILSLDAEHSWDTELGGRARAGDWLSSEVTLFWLAFQNQLVPPSETIGAPDDTVVTGGATTHLGVESTVRVDPAGGYGSEVHVPLTLTYTFVHATFGDGWGVAVKGQPMAYAPAHQLTATAGVVLPFGLDAQVKGSYVSSQWTDKVATVEPSNDGLVGRIDPYLLLDAQVGYTHAKTGISVFVACKNLLDTDWIASRTPRGIQPGTPRHIFGGIGWTL